MKTPNEVATEVEHLDNMARETNDPRYGRQAVALLDDLAARQTGGSRWSTMSFAMKLRLAWEPEASSTEQYFLGFVREVEGAQHANVVERKNALRCIRTALHGSLSASMKTWRDSTDCQVTVEDLKATYPGLPTTSG